MAALFSAISFETGDLTEFDGRDTAGTGVTLSAHADAAKVGSYGLKVVSALTTDVSDEDAGYKGFTWPVSDLAVFELWYRRAAFVQDGYDAAQAKSFWRLYDGTTGNPVVYLNYQDDIVEMCYMNDSFTKVSLGAGWRHTPVLNTWYRYRVLVQASGADTLLTWKVSTDGSSFSTINSTTLATRLDNMISGGWTPRVQVGLRHEGQFEKNEMTVHIDLVEGFDAEPVAGGGIGAGHAIALWMTGFPRQGGHL